MAAKARRAIRIDPPVFHEEVCDASGAVPADPEGASFLVADDEEAECLLRLYKTDQSGPPVARLHLKNKKLAAPDAELDLEAAAWLGDRIFWIGSHSRDKKGKKQETRRRLFATTLRDGKTLRLDGEPYCDLIPDLKRLFSASGSPWDGFTTDPKSPPKSGGLSIEGLAGSPEGELLIGLRSPLADRNAVIVTLRNPEEAIQGKEAAFAAPLALSLEGRGIRSLEYCHAGACYLVLAGAAGAGGDFLLYRWDRRNAVSPLLDFASMKLPEGVAPEAMFLSPDGARLHVLFDEGNRLEDQTPCKKSKRRSFRSVCIHGLVR